MKPFIFFILLFLSFGSKAQFTPKDQVMADSLVEEMYQHNPLFKGLQAQLRQQKTMLQMEKSSWFSGITVGMQVFSLQQATTPEGSSYQGGLLPNLGGGIQLNIHQVLNTPLRIRIAKEDVNRAQAGLETQQLEAEKWLRMKFYEWVQAREQIRISNEILQTLKEQETLVRYRFQKGEAKLVELLQIQTAISQNSESLLKQQIFKEKCWKEIELYTQSR